jgi:CRISPR system Cascade subunit CasE
MFISRIEIAWTRARNPYDLHRVVWMLFPEIEQETRRQHEQDRQGFLFRIENYRAGSPVRLLAQSRVAPQPAPSVALLGIREFDPQPQMGQRLAFVLTANPVKTIKDTEAESKPGKRPDKHGNFKCRVPLIKEEDQHAWLLGKLTGAAEILAASILPHQPLYFRKGNRGGKLMTVTFEGILQVSDPENLVRLLHNGIGPAKAFGCGLMLVRRV